MFDQLKQLWNSMTPQERQKKLDALRDITFLKSFCEARGLVKFNPQKMSITIFWRTSEVIRLLAAFKRAGYQNIKIFDLTKKNFV